MTECQALEQHERAQRHQQEGRHSEAVADFAAAANWFAATEGEQSPDLANILMDQADSVLALCRYTEAEQIARRAKNIVTAIQAQLDEESRWLLLPRALGLWGRTLRELGRYEEASAPLLAAMDASSTDDLPAHLNEYGILCKYWGKYDEGECIYLRALTLLQERHGQDAPETASIYHNLGGLEHTRGNFAKGEPYGRKAYEIRRRASGEDHPDTVADAVAWAGLLDGLERTSESVPMYRRALSFYEQHLGPEHFEVAATLNNLGMAEAAEGRLEEARKTLHRCLAVKRKLFADNHPEVRLTQRNLDCLTEQS